MGRKTRNRASGGFTLVEMLVVVAIIAVLVVVSIPLVSASLEEAREAADAANERAAKAAALAAYLLAEESDAAFYGYKADGTVQGVRDNIELSALGGEGYDYGQSQDNKKKYVGVSIVYGSNGILQIETQWYTNKSV